jgi:NAD+ synthase
MRERQSQIIADLSVRQVIDPAKEVEARVAFLRDYLVATGAAGFVLAISGGQDSSLAGRLCQLAVEGLARDGVDAEFIAVRMPYVVQSDEEDAQLALAFIQPQRVVTYNIARGVDGVRAEYADALGAPGAPGAPAALGALGALGGEMTDFTKGNVKARIRMVAQYAIAGQRGMLVVGTDHAAEAVTGFFTKFGDGGVDLTPLSGLTKRQGRALLEQLGAPERLYLKAPTADLLDDTPGQTDEANLGLTYSDIDDFLEGRDVAPAVADAIEARYLATEHKRRVPASPLDTWWR